MHLKRNALAACLLLVMAQPCFATGKPPTTPPPHDPPPANWWNDIKNTNSNDNSNHNQNHNQNHNNANASSKSDANATGVGLGLGLGIGEGGNASSHATGGNATGGNAKAEGGAGGFAAQGQGQGQDQSQLATGGSVGNIGLSNGSNSGSNTLNNGSNSGGNSLSNGSASGASADNSGGNSAVNVDASDRSSTQYESQALFLPSLPPVLPPGIPGAVATVTYGQCGPLKAVESERVSGTYLGLFRKHKIDLGRSDRIVPYAGGEYIERKYPDGSVRLFGNMAVRTTAVLNVAGSRSVALGGGKTGGDWGQAGGGGGSAMQQLVTHIDLEPCEAFHSAPAKTVYVEVAQKPPGQ